MAATSAGLLSYVPCPACGHPVGGRLPQPPEELKLTCLHCSTTFAFEPNAVRRGLVSYDHEADRWKVESFRGR
jgi:hypothetical protein